MLTKHNISELHKLGDTRDKVEWRIGEIALEAWNRNIKSGGRYHRFQVFTAVAREARCSKGRVEKLFAMVQFYPVEIRQRYPDYKLGHYETAMNFGPEEAPEVLEYIQVYKEDKGELPKVNALDFLYRNDVLGQDPESIIQPKPTYHPDAAHDRIIALLQSIRAYLANKHLSGSVQTKMLKGLELIEEALAELANAEVIHRN